MPIPQLFRPLDIVVNGNEGKWSKVTTTKHFLSQQRCRHDSAACAPNNTVDLSVNN